MMSNGQDYFCVALDVDGVLLKDGKPIPGAIQAIQFLQSRKIPFIFLTNGGGDVESKKAEYYTQLFGDGIDPISPEQIILSHTPMRDLVPLYQNKRVLIIGDEDEKKGLQIMKHYGFQNAIHLTHYLESHPDLCPYTKYKYMSGLNQRDKVHDDIHAIFVLELPSTQFYESLQVCCDVIVSNGNPMNDDSVHVQINEQKVALYFSNPDLQYAGAFKEPRFTQGSFRLCLEALYDKVSPNQRKLEYTLFGKPSNKTYQYGEKQLLKQFQVLKKNQCDLQHFRDHVTVYMIGDNPLSDIQGANQYGWYSILVRTGCFQGKDNSTEFPAKKVCQNVWDAIQFIDKKHIDNSLEQQ